MKRILLSSQTDSVELTPGEHVIGRDVACQLRFNDAAVSRRHVLIRVGDAAVTIEDLGSRNGTYLNGRLLVAQQPLRDGDEIRVGRRLFRVHELEGEGATDERTSTDPRGAEALRRFADLFEAERKERGSTVPPPPPSPPSVTCAGCRGAVPIHADRCPSCGRSRQGRTLGVTMTLSPEVVKELAAIAEEREEDRPADDRRRSRRYPVELPLIYISQTLMFEAVGTDLSAHGIFIATELFDELGTACSVTLLPDGASALHLTGHVRRVVEPAGEGSTTGIGIEFEGVKPPMLAALARLIGRTRIDD